jgi:hypothetical protein
MSEIIGAVTYLLVGVMWYFVGRGDRSKAAWCAFVLCTILAMSHRLLGQQVSDLEATVKELQQTCECNNE